MSDWLSSFGAMSKVARSMASMFPVRQSSSANSWLVLICAANSRRLLRLTPNAVMLARQSVSRLVQHSDGADHQPGPDHRLPAQGADPLRRAAGRNVARRTRK